MSTHPMFMGIGAFAAAAMLALGPPTAAQDFPSRTVTLVVAGAAGLPADIVARTLAPAMRQHLGQPVVVENKLGAGSLIGYEFAARSKPDGYTIAVVSEAQLASFPATVKDLRFDPLKDLPPFIGLGEGRVLLVGTRANVGWTQYPDMVRAFQGKPGTLNFGVSAPNTVLLAHAFLQHHGIQGQIVPYSNAGPLVTDLVAGVNHMIWLGQSAVANVSARTSLLGISGRSRSAALPEVPTFDELGLKGIPGLGYSLNAPAGVPPERLAALFRAAAHALDQDDVKSRFAQMQLDIQMMDAKTADQRFQAAARLFSAVAKRADYKPE
jgi:tripartite-type tricarboxylate transporter receptor subunit TctC